mmetsp:Transcript_17483/g.39617  ORF Transcript_17483/g.39617 Transcript_17483/m.39617 type:complete len:138 (+) Transcript_17483:89-502(+)
MAPTVITQRVFEALDRDCDSKLGASDIAKVLGSTTGYEAKAETLEALAGEGLSLEALCDVVASHRDSIEEKDITSLAFGLCDKEGDGLLGAAALRAGLQLLGLEATEEEVKELVKEFDQDGDGKLCQAEFLALMAAE